jgi:hypothetical protein
MAAGLARAPGKVGNLNHSCRLCAGGDLAATIEHVAEQMWESRRSAGLDPPWAEAGEFWRERFLELATVAVASLR